MAEVTPVGDVEAVVGCVSSAGRNCERVPVAMRETSQMQGKQALRSLTACLDHHSPATLQMGKAGWSRHQPASKVAVPADIHGGNAVAENYPSELSDALSVRNQERRDCAVMTANRSFQFRQASLVPLCGWVWVFAALVWPAQAAAADRPAPGRYAAVPSARDPGRLARGSSAR